MSMSISWRDNRADGRLQSFNGSLKMTDQPGTFVYTKPNYTLPRE